jgi:predicted DNA-binding protein (UPF0251 family)
MIEVSRSAVKLLCENALKKIAIALVNGPNTY